MEMRKKATSLLVINKPIIYKFFKDIKVSEKLVNNRIVDHLEKYLRPTGWYFLAVQLSPTFLNTENTNETYQCSGKQDSFGHILNSSASIYGSSG